MNPTLQNTRLLRSSILGAVWLIAHVLGLAGLPLKAEVVGRGEVTVFFPPGSTPETNAETGWRIQWAFDPPRKACIGPYRLRIERADFWLRDVDRNPQWVPIADEIVIGEIFAVYNGLPNHGSKKPGPQHFVERHFELSGSDEGLLPMDTQMGSPASMYVKGLASNGVNYALLELAQDDLQWMEEQKKMGLRYGHKLVIWSALYSNTYRYIIRHTFHDDGRITLEVGATGANTAPRAPKGEWAKFQARTHIHLATWKLRFLLGETPEANTVWKFSNKHRGQFGDLLQQRIDEEQGVDLDPDYFERLSISGTMRVNPDSWGPVSYDILGDYTRLHDFCSSTGQFGNYSAWLIADEYTDNGILDENIAMCLPDYVNRPPTSIRERRSSVWLNGAFLHIPRQEDFDKNGQTLGVATLMWHKTTLKPRDLMVATPFYK